MSVLKKIIFSILFFFYAVGVCNYGFTKIYPVLPLILPILFMVKHDERLLKKYSIILVIGFLINISIFYNPLFFPILLSPSFKVNQDCNLVIYSDNSAGFDDLNEVHSNEPLGTQVKLIKKGTLFPIREVYTFGGIDSENSLYLKSDGFSINTENSRNFIETDLPLENPVFKYFSYLIYIPVMSILGIFQLLALLPGGSGIVRGVIDTILNLMKGF